MAGGVGRLVKMVGTWALGALSTTGTTSTLQIESDTHLLI